MVWTTSLARQLRGLDPPTQDKPSVRQMALQVILPPVQDHSRTMIMTKIMTMTMTKTMNIHLEQRPRG